MKITILSGYYAHSQRKIRQGKKALSIEFDRNPSPKELCYQKARQGSEWWVRPGDQQALAFRSKDVQRIFLKQTNHYWRVWAKIHIPVGGDCYGRTEYVECEVRLDQTGYAYSADAEKEARKWAKAFDDPGLFRRGWDNQPCTSFSGDKKTEKEDQPETSKPGQGYSKESKPDDPSLDAVAHCTSSECPYFHLGLSDSIRADYDRHGDRAYIGPDYRCTAPVHADGETPPVYLGKVCEELYSKRYLKKIIDEMDRKQREEEMRNMQIWE